MNKEDNPFYTLAQQIKSSANIQQINEGKVISVSPLLINCNGIQLDREDLLINSDLLVNSLKVGSIVVLLTNDNQKFYLICEVA